VLPGVTVEAASPALIEKVRTVVTDSQGEYKIVDLRSGTYSVTFNLPGFSTVRREGLELTTGFTASVDAELRVGAIAETVIVTGASPVVDTQNVRTQNVLSRDTLDTLPTGKTSYAWAALTLGMNVSGSGGGDVGGNQGESHSSIAIHGGRHIDQRLFMDGMSYNAGTSTGHSKAMFPNQMAIQEITLETSGQNAEVETAGVQINLVPKEGGNSFRGAFLAAYTNSHLQSDNLDDALRARGITTTPTAKRIYDYGMAVGGPIKRDRVWFFTAQRWWGAGAFAPGNYFNATPHTLFYTPDLSRPAFTDIHDRDTTVRLTWQAAAKHKITFSESFQDNCLCYYMVDQNRAPEATRAQVYYPLSLAQAGWTYPRTSRLLLQAGVTDSITGFKQSGDDVSTLHDIPITELSTGYVYGAADLFNDPSGPGGRTDFPQRNGQFTVSYVTGSHALKTGVSI
jgi:carboxypeptidase family protein